MNTSVGFRQAVEVVALHLSVASAATGLTSPDGTPQVDIADRLSGELNGVGVHLYGERPYGHIVSVRTLATLPFLARTVQEEESSAWLYWNAAVEDDAFAHETQAWYTSVQSRTAMDHAMNVSMSPASIVAESMSPRKAKISHVTRNVQDYESLIVAKLVQEGLDVGAAEDLLRTRWSEGGKQGLATAWKQWAEYVTEQVDEAIDLLEPTAVQLVNFLRRVRHGQFRTGAKQGVQTKGAWIRGVRSAISTTMALWSQTSSIGSHPLVTGYITAVLNEDFNVLRKRGYRYDDTWDVELLFDMLRRLKLETFLSCVLTAASGVTKGDWQKSVCEVRDAAVALARVVLACRSHDLSCIYRGARSEHDCLRFHLAGTKECPLVSGREHVMSVGGEPEPPSSAAKPAGPFGVLGVSIRYFGPKQRHSMAVRSHGYTDWITVDSVADDPAVCLACLLYWYVRASEMLPAGLIGDATFVSNTARKDRGNKFYNLTPDALAAIMKRNMKAAGVPEDFLPHSARAAGMAFHKKGGYTEDMVLARANLSSRTYKLHYERQIRRKEYVPPAGIPEHGTPADTGSAASPVGAFDFHG